MIKRVFRLLFTNYKAKACQIIALKNMMGKIHKYSGQNVGYVEYWQYIRALYGVDHVSKLTNSQWKSVYAELAGADMADSMLDTLIHNIEQREWIAKCKE